MRACVQRVLRAAVRIDGASVAEIGRGLVVLLGVAQADRDADRSWIADKLASLRIFDDAAGKMNLDVRAAGGSLLVVSQFTLLADCRKGRRPSFDQAAPPEQAEAMYDALVRELKERGLSVATGRFRQHMEVELVNDGPVTVLIDSAQR